MIIKKNKRIGIWGFGVVGQSVTRYLHDNGYEVGVMDKREFTPTEIEDFKQKNITVYKQEDKNKFFNSYEILLSSPGVYIANDYPTFLSKWVHELDLFYDLFNKPIIAITGSIGKTSVTHIIAKIFECAQKQICVGGNIGIPTFDLLPQQENVELALLEVSSFQLHYCKQFAPKLALLTNFHPNHLDHHTTEQEYFLAKCAIFAHQTENDYSLVPFELRSIVPPAAQGHKRAYFTTTELKTNQLVQLLPTESVYFIENNTVMRYANDMTTAIINLSTLTPFSFVQNRLIAASVCDIMQISPNILHPVAATLQLPAHRLEKIASVDSVDFYNDSKATTTASTCAAVEQLKNRPLHLFLGGLSKGVDRAPFIAQLKNTVNFIYCFGSEAQELHTMCKKNNIPSAAFADLHTAFSACALTIKPGDSVLLSPAGSSYDLYKNYEERGNHFKKLVEDYIQAII